MRSGQIVGERKFASLVGWNCTREIVTIYGWRVSTEAGTEGSSLPRGRFLALRDIQKTAARETIMIVANKQLGVYCSSPTTVYYCDR